LFTRPRIRHETITLAGCEIYCLNQKWKKKDWIGGIDPAALRLAPHF